MGIVSAKQTVQDFEQINKASGLNWAFKSQVSKFIKRFWKDPYRQEDVKWMQELVKEYDIKVKTKFSEIQKLM